MAHSSGDKATKWQERSFAETNLRMLEDELLCDVTFLAGKKQEPVKAHRFMLASRSPVFYAMFCGPLAENQEAILVPDIDVDIFKLVIRFMYTTDCTLTGDSVMATLYAARKYEVEALVKKCSEFLQDHIDDENVCTVLQQAITFDAPDLTKQCLSYIFNNGQNVFQSRSFLSIDYKALQRILESDDLKLGELDIYRACVQWAQYQCTEASEETSDDTVRKRLGDLVYLIRFPVMSQQEFTEHVSQSGVLRDDEIVSIFQGYCVKVSNKHKFVSKPRLIDMVFERFKEIYANWGHNGTENAISFFCSRTVLLKGVFLFSPCVSSQTNGELAIADDNSTLWKTKIALQYDANKKTEEVAIEPPLSLERGKVFHLIQTCTGQTYYGKIRKMEENMDIKVTFSSSSRNQCGTNDQDEGQFFALRLM